MLWQVSPLDKLQTKNGGLAKRAVPERRLFRPKEVALLQPVSRQAPRVLKSREIAGLALTECSYPPGLRMSKHSHELAYFSLVLHGSYTETIGKTELSVRPAALVAHPPEHAHAVIFHCREVRIFRTEIQPPWLERLREHSVFFESPACFDGDIIAGLALRLYREFRAPDKYSPPAVEGILLEMLAEISRCEEQSAALRAPRWLERAREMLHEHATKILSPSEIATEVGVHPVHLAHEFRRFYRASIGEYARRLRVEAACREMAESDLPLSEIAANAGFYDQSHFSNVFKRHTGMTPTAFRSAVRTH